MRRALVIAALVLLACEGEQSAAPASSAPVVEEEGQHLGVPPALIQRARREARGLHRLPPSLREEALVRNRAGAPSYADLRRDADAHASEPASFEGQIALIRPAGARLWIMALKTRRDGERWTDPLYVLSVIEPTIEEGAIGRVDGWVAGNRTIGRNTLPLIVAYSIAPVAQ